MSTGETADWPAGDDAEYNVINDVISETQDITHDC